EHLGPVHGLRPTRARVDLDDRVGAVLGAGEHGAKFQIADRGLDGVEAFLRLARGVAVVRLLGEFEEGLGVLQLADGLFPGGDQRIGLRLFLVERLRLELVVPEPGVQAHRLDFLGTTSLPIDVKDSSVAPGVVRRAVRSFPSRRSSRSRFLSSRKQPAAFYPSNQRPSTPSWASFVAMPFRAGWPWRNCTSASRRRADEAQPRWAASASSASAREGATRTARTRAWAISTSSCSSAAERREIRYSPLSSRARILPARSSRLIQAPSRYTASAS